VNREQLLRRIAAIEAALAPPKPVVWSPWQIILNVPEHELIVELLCRGASHGGDPSNSATWCDDFAAWRALCVDDRERELLAAIEAKAEESVRSGRVEPLFLYLMDLCA
jgi:hypothetical protein